MSCTFPWFLDLPRRIVILSVWIVAQTSMAQSTLTPTLSDVSTPITSSDPSSLYLDVAQFGGPSSVGGQIAEDATVVPQFRWQRLQDRFQPWYLFKENANEHRRLQFDIDESIFFQVASQSPAESSAASGLVRVYGQWEPFRRANSDHEGFLVFKVEDRHRIGTNVTPFELGFQAGSIVPTGTFFNEFHFSVTNLFWKQYFADRRMAVAVGRIDVTDFVDVYAMINPLTHFINLAFSTNPTIAPPNQGLGIAAGGMLTDNIYLQGGLADANGQPTQAGFNTFFDDREYFSYLEAGITSTQERIYLDNLHATLWHTDARQAAQSPSGWGIAVTAQKLFADRWLPFFRFGYSAGDAALLQTVFSTGIGLSRANHDVAGLGISFGKPSDGTLRDQFTNEYFYRFQFTQFLALTPNIQLVANPSLAPDQDALALFGVRLRMAL